MKSLGYLLIMVLFFSRINSLASESKISLLNDKLFSENNLSTPYLALTFSKNQKYSFVMNYSQANLKQFCVLDFFLIGRKNKEITEMNISTDINICDQVLPEMSCSTNEIERLKHYNTYTILKKGQECGSLINNLLCISKCQSSDSKYEYFSNQKINGESQLILNISKDTCLSLFTLCNIDNINDDDYVKYCENDLKLPMRINLRVTDKNFVTIINKNEMNKLFHLMNNDNYIKSNFRAIYYYAISNYNELFEIPIQNLIRPIDATNLIPGSFEKHLFIISKIFFPNFTFASIKLQSKILKILRFFIEYLKFHKVLNNNVNSLIIQNTEISRKFYWFCTKFGSFLSRTEDYNNKRRLDMIDYLISYNEFEAIMFILFDSYDFTDEIYQYNLKFQARDDLKNYIDKKFYFLWLSLKSSTLDLYKHIVDITHNFVLFKVNEIYERVSQVEKYLQKMNVTTEINNIYNKTGIIKTSIVNKEIIHNNKNTTLDIVHISHLNNDVSKIKSTNNTMAPTINNNINEETKLYQDTLMHNLVINNSNTNNNHSKYLNIKNEDKIKLQSIIQDKLNFSTHVVNLNNTKVGKTNESLVLNKTLSTESNKMINTTINMYNLPSKSFNSLKPLANPIESWKNKYQLNNTENKTIYSAIAQEQSHNKNILNNSTGIIQNKSMYNNSPLYANTSKSKFFNNENNQIKIININNITNNQIKETNSTINNALIKIKEFTDLYKFIKEKTDFDKNAINKTKIMSNESHISKVKPEQENSNNNIHSKLTSPHEVNESKNNISSLTKIKFENDNGKTINISKEINYENKSKTFDHEHAQKEIKEIKSMNKTIIKWSYNKNESSVGQTLIKHNKTDNNNKTQHLDSSKLYNINNTKFHTNETNIKNGTKTEVFYIAHTKNQNKSTSNETHLKSDEKIVEDETQLTKNQTKINKNNSKSTNKYTKSAKNETFSIKTKKEINLPHNGSYVQQLNTTKFSNKEIHHISNHSTHTKIKIDETKSGKQNLANEHINPSGQSISNKTSINHNDNIKSNNTSILTIKGNYIHLNLNFSPLNGTKAQQKVNNLTNHNTNSLYNFIKLKANITSKNNGIKIKNKNNKTKLLESELYNMTKHNNSLLKELKLKNKTHISKDHQYNQKINKSSHHNNTTSSKASNGLVDIKYNNSHNNVSNLNNTKHEEDKKKKIKKKKKDKKKHHKNDTSKNSNLSKVNNTNELNNATLYNPYFNFILPATNPLYPYPYFYPFPFNSSYQGQFPFFLPQYPVKGILTNEKNNSYLNDTHSDDTVGLIAYDVSIFGWTLLYYLAVMILFLSYFITIQILFNKCYEYFIQHKYKLSTKNYSYLVINLLICLVINLVIALLLYSDILIVLIFAVDSELIAATISFHSNHGSLYGPLAFPILSILVTFKLLNFHSVILKIIIMSAIAVLFFFIGAHLGMYQFIEYEKLEEQATRIRKPVNRMGDESYINL